MQQHGWMDLELIILSEVNQTKMNTAICYHLGVESKIWHKWSDWQNRLTDVENKHGYQGGSCGGGINYQFGIIRSRPLYIK